MLMRETHVLEKNLVLYFPRAAELENFKGQCFSDEFFFYKYGSYCFESPRLFYFARVRVNESKYNTNNFVLLNLVEFLNADKI